MIKTLSMEKFIEISEIWEALTQENKEALLIFLKELKVIPKYSQDELTRITSADY